jgi:GT2 family glycosyltransferase
MNFNKILDIIIPVYNSDKDLYHTLCSLNSIDTNEINEIIIIDDASYKNNNYTEIISFFSNFMTIKYCKLEKNLGPGGAR